MNTPPQPELDFETPAETQEVICDLAEMERLLAAFGGWTRAKDFPAPWSERTLRSVASESEGRIISGQRGYKLTRLATPEERHHSTRWLRHQAQVMNKRAIEIDLVAESLAPAVAL